MTVIIVQHGIKPEYFWVVTIIYLVLITCLLVWLLVKIDKINKAVENELGYTKR